MNQKIKTKSNSRTFEFLFLFILAAISFSIRVIGVKFGNPLLTNGDEVRILEHVSYMTGNLSLDSQFYARPDQILFLLNFVLMNTISLLKTGHTFATTYTQSPFEYFVYSRILVVFLGALVPIVAYLIGKEYSKKAGIFAGLIFAVFPAYVEYSHFISPDIPITLFSLVVVLFVIRYLRDENKKWLYWAIAFAAINTVEKFPGAFSFLLIAFAIFWRQIKQNSGNKPLIVRNSLKKVALAFLLFLFGTYLLAPNLYFNFGDTFHAVIYEARSNHLGADGLNWFGNLGYYLGQFLNKSNLVFDLLALLGIYTLFRTKKFNLTPVFYGVVYWLLLSFLALHWERWAMPMYVTPLLLAAFGLAFLWEWIGQSKWLKWTVGLLFAGALAYSLVYSLSISIRMSYTDTTVVALDYCNQNGITRENSTFENYTPFSPNYSDSNFDYEGKKNNGKYILLSSKLYDRYFAEPNKYPGEVSVYNAIRARDELMREFVPTTPASNNPFVSWLDDIGYSVQKLLGKDLPERTTGSTIQIYKAIK